MLKTIEETPSHVIFIFATTEIYKIPATILSRCQYYQFGRLVDEQLNQMIFKIAKLENINIDKLAINKIVSLVDGSARDALSILEQLAMYSNNNITIATINEVFGLIDDQQKLALINDIITHNTQTIMQRLDTYALQGINFGQLANELILILIDKLVYLQTKDLTLLKKLTSTNVNDVNINQKQAIDLINV
jgi:DNA polymerase-3 subunit gamma/tau